MLPARTKIIATDLNLPMLDVAQRKFAHGEPVVLQPEDAMNLSFDDACCDLVVSQFGLMFYPDKDASHREIFRVLEDGGHYLLSV